jgi:NAD(P)H-dependent FMN reductase
VTVVALSGSLREQSYTRLALRRALDAAETAGADASLLDLRSFDLPPLNPDVDAQGDGAAFTRRVREADAVLLGTPMYHGSYSGVLKNALDHCGFDEFEGKTVGLLGVAGGAFPITALEHLRSVCRALDAWVLPIRRPSRTRHRRSRIRIRTTASSSSTTASNLGSPRSVAVSSSTPPSNPIRGRSKASRTSAGRPESLCLPASHARS